MPGDGQHDAKDPGSILPSLFGEVIALAPIGVAVVDYDGRYRSVNPAYCRLYGYAEADLLGQSFLKVFPAAERSQLLARHQAFLSGQGAMQGELTAMRHDGSPLHIVIDSVRLAGDGGRGLRLVYVVDVTTYKELETSLRRSADTYRTLFETVPQGIVYYDLDGNVLTANPAALRILEIESRQLVGTNVRDWAPRLTDVEGTAIDPRNLPSSVALRTGERVRGVIMGLETRQRGRTWIEVSAVPLFKEGRLHQVYACFEDITERVNLGRALEERATRDFLTGIANRASAMDQLAVEWNRKRRQPDQQCAVMLLDLDFFKTINDSRGHAAGDRVLRHVSAQLVDSVRAADLVGRVGGEEFLVLLRGTGLAGALQLAQRICDRIAANPAQLDGTALPVTISIGVSVLRYEDANVDAVLARADRALYAAKRAGRNRVHAHADPLPTD